MAKTRSEEWLRETLERASLQGPDEHDLRGWRTSMDQAPAQKSRSAPYMVLIGVAAAVVTAMVATTALTGILDRDHSVNEGRPSQPAPGFASAGAEPQGVTCSDSTVMTGEFDGIVKPNGEPFETNPSLETLIANFLGPDESFLVYNGENNEAVVEILRPDGQVRAAIRAHYRDRWDTWVLDGVTACTGEELNQGG